MSFPAQKAFPQQFGSPAPTGRSKHGYTQGQGGSSGRGHSKNERVMSMLPNELKIPKPPKQPDKPLPAYMRYSRKVWEKVKLQNPDMKMWDIGKLIGEQWRNLPEDERQGFFAEYEVEKAEYQEAMKAYHNSPAYRDWLKAKERATNALQEQQMMEKMMGGPLPKEEPRFQLQQIDEEEDDSEYSAKQVACARFQRNHKLIADIFSDATVPDIKTIVTRPRLENLKRQVQSLMQHQRKLESEIEEMESRFMTKKQKIVSQTNSFIERMKDFDEKNQKLLLEAEKSLKHENEKETPTEENKDTSNDSHPQTISPTPETTPQTDCMDEDANESKDSSLPAEPMQVDTTITSVESERAPECPSTVSNVALPHTASNIALPHTASISTPSSSNEVSTSSTIEPIVSSPLNHATDNIPSASESSAAVPSNFDTTPVQTPSITSPVMTSPNVTTTPSIVSPPPETQTNSVPSDLPVSQSDAPVVVSTQSENTEKSVG